MAKRISVTVPDNLAEDIRRIQATEMRTESNTVALLLLEAVQRRKAVEVADAR